MKLHFRYAWENLKAKLVFKGIRRNLLLVLPGILCGSILALLKYFNSDFDYHGDIKSEIYWWALFLFIMLMCCFVWGFFYYQLVNIKYKTKIFLFKIAIWSCTGIICSISTAIGITIMYCILNISIEYLTMILFYLLLIEHFLELKYNFKYELCVVEENVYADKLNR